MSNLDSMACGFTKVIVYNIISVTPIKLPNEKEINFSFLFFWGATRYVTVYIISFLFLVLCFILYLIKAKIVYMFRKFHFPDEACHSNCYSS